MLRGKSDCWFMIKITALTFKLKPLRKEHWQDLRNKRCDIAFNKHCNIRAIHKIKGSKAYLWNKWKAFYIIKIRYIDNRIFGILNHEYLRYTYWVTYMCYWNYKLLFIFRFIDLFYASLLGSHNLYILFFTKHQWKT